MMELSYNDVREALAYIDPNRPRAEWVKIGFAIKSQFPGEDGQNLFDEWSSRGDGYKAKEIPATWRSFNSSGGVGLGTLLQEAQSKGYKAKAERDGVSTPPPVRSAQLIEQARVDALIKAADEAEQVGQRHTEVAARAMGLWDRNRALAEGEQVGYLQRKDVAGVGVRVSQDGTILVPLRDENNNLWNIQFLKPVKTEDAPDKVFLKDGRKAGLWHMMGEPVDGGKLLIAEGYATAATLHEATQLPVAMGIDSGNLSKVANALHKLYPNAQIMLCADNDVDTERSKGYNPGVRAASAAAQAIGARLTKPENFPDGKKDFNDMVEFMGKDRAFVAIRAQIDQAFGVAKPLAETQPVNAMSDSPEPQIATGADAPAAQAAGKTTDTKQADPTDPNAAADQTPNTEAANEYPQTPMLQNLRLAYEKLGDQYLRAEGKFFFRDEPTKLAFEDKRGSLSTQHNNPDVIRSMVELASAKGWKTLHLRGTEDFMREAWIEGNLKGIKVSGYEPQPIDQVRLKERLAQQLHDKGGISPTANVMSSDPIRRPEVSSAPFQPEQHAKAEAKAESKAQAQALREADVMRDLTRILSKQGIPAEQAQTTLDAVKGLLVTERTYVGRVVGFGPAPYKHEPLKKGEKLNYYIRLEDHAGKARDIWGVDLKRTIAERGIQNGDEVLVAYQGTKLVEVDVPRFDADKKFLGTDKQVKQRNEWLTERVSDLHLEAKEGVVHQFKTEAPQGARESVRFASPDLSAVSVVHAALAMRGIPTEIIHASLAEAQASIQNNPQNVGSVGVKLMDKNGVEHIGASVNPAQSIVTPVPQTGYTVMPAAPSPAVIPTQPTSISM